MHETKSSGFDPVGAKALAETVKLATEAAIDGAGAFLSRICLPAAEEFGLLLKDRVSDWRARNALRITGLAEQAVLDKDVHAHPRIVFSILEQGSWSDDDFVQRMWAGLLASSCNQDGDDQSNLIFVSILSQLTPSEVRILNFAVERSKKAVSKSGWVYIEYDADDERVTLSTLQQVSGVMDIDQIDREIDHLASLDLIPERFHPDAEALPLRATALALQLYARCKGSKKSVRDFFGL